MEVGDVAQLGKPEAASSEPGANNLKTVIQRVSGTSVLEIERLIAELQTLRDPSARAPPALPGRFRS